MNQEENIRQLVDILFLTELHVYQAYLGLFVFILGCLFLVINIIRGIILIQPKYGWNSTSVVFNDPTDTKKEKENKRVFLRWLFISFLMLNIAIVLIFSSICIFIYLNFILLYRYAKKYYETLLIKEENNIAELISISGLFIILTFFITMFFFFIKTKLLGLG